MANSRYDFEVNADNSKFKRVISDSMKQLDDLSAKTGGTFANMSGKFGEMSGMLNSIKGMPAPLMAVGAAATAATLALSAFNSSRDHVKMLNELATQSGMTVEELQKMKSAFKETGLDIEKFGDINRDTLDKLADGVKDGSGIVEDLRAYGIEVQQYAGYLNEADGGFKAVIKTFYEMEKAGKSQAEIINMMEAMGSDASKLIPTLRALGSEEAAMLQMTKGTATITNSTAEAYARYEKAVGELSDSFENARAEALAPFVEILTDVVEGVNNVSAVINSLKTDDSQAAVKALREEYGLLVDVMDAYLKADNFVKGLSRKFEESQDTTAGWGHAARNWLQDKVGLENYDNGYGSDEWKARQQAERDLRYDGPASQGPQPGPVAKPVSTEPTPVFKDKDADKQKDDAAKKAQKAAQDSARALEKELADRKRMLTELNSLNMSLYTDSAASFAQETQQGEANLTKLNELLNKGIITQEEFDTKRKAIIDQSAGALEALMLGAQPGDLQEILSGINKVYEDQKNNLKSQFDSQLISREEYLSKVELLEQMHTARMYEFQVAKDDSLAQLRELGYTTDDENYQLEMEKLEEQFEKLQSDNAARYEAQIIDHEAFLAQKDRLEQIYAAKSQELENNKLKAQMSMTQSYANSAVQITEGIFGKQSGAAKVAFGVSKALAIANSTIDAHSAATKAMAMYPGPMGIAMAGASYAGVLAQVAQIKSTNLTGMAHDGIDNVPTEGTWLLQEGERVVDNRTNADLKDFLKDGAGQSPIEVNAPLTIQGNVDSSDRMVMDAINRYPEQVARMVEKAQSRRM